MSTIFVFAGQCGNQLGYELNQLLGKSDAEGSRNVFSNDQGYIRAICVDSESKVVSRALGQGQKTFAKVQSCNQISGRKGRGNNWALGYTGQSGEPILEQTLHAVRKEAERCPMFSNIILCHSLCGGTGGGFGSRLLEELRDTFPVQHVISCVVAPFAAGDAPLQHYNGLLSLAALQKFSDAVLLFKNDSVRDILSANGEPVSYSKMNQYIASTIAGIILPTDTLTAGNGLCLGLEPSEIVRVVCPQHSLKFLTANHVTSAEADPSSMCSSVIHRSKHEASSVKLWGLSHLLVVRGPQANGFLSDLTALEKKIKTRLNCASWNPFPIDIWTASKCPVIAKHSSQVTLLSNLTSVTSLLDSTWTKARAMYDQRAYLHWYQKYGILQDYFEESFNTVEEITSNYVDSAS